MYVAIIASPLIAVGIYSAIALSMAGVVFNPIVAAGIFIGMSFLSAVCFAIVKISEKVSEEKAKNSDTGTLTALGNVLAPECLKSDNFLKQS
ncbi:hypothetical protein [Candidatus Mesenet endosymbiont of Agriotes lineatus]|uniref:hypothetical protein n=1 Tax=Candidatus Mesenet endosymbiont of Agriotes lineatus TaxID=3077948 RepID=UPI0030D275CE